MLRSRKARFDLVTATASLSLVVTSLLAPRFGPRSVAPIAHAAVCEAEAAPLPVCSIADSLESTAVTERDVDEMFLEARELAYSGDRHGARALASEILARTPDYLDVSVFLARVHAWDGEFAVAKGLIEEVLNRDPAYLEARKAQIDVALWSGNEEDALALVEAAVATTPDDSELMDRRARILRAIEARDVATAAGEQGTDTVSVAAAIAAPDEGADVPQQTEHAEMILARTFDGGPRARSRAPGTIVDDEDEARGVQYRGAVEYFLDHFSKDLDDWHQVNLSIEREASWGSVIGRVGYYNRLEESAALFELDLYPQLRKGTYAYLNAGVSTQDILPDYRLAAEVYQAVPLGLEMSIGWRQIRFDFTTNVLTPSLGWYKGNYWFLVRPLISFAEGESTVSWVARARRYFSDPEEYVTLTFAKGRALEENTADATLFALDSVGGFVEGRKRIHKRLVAKLAFGYESQELPGRSDRGRFTFASGLEYLF